MYKATLDGVKLKSSLHELAQLGSPVDLSVAASNVEYQKVEIQQIGGVHDSKIFELQDGRVGLMADIAVTNQTSRPIDVVDVVLSTSWSNSFWDWLTPRRIESRGRSRNCGYVLYSFPGKCGQELEYDLVINHHLLENRRLPSRRPREGFLVGIGGPMPADLRHGQMVDLTLAIIGSDHAEYAVAIHLWTDRLEGRSQVAERRRSLFEQGRKEHAVQPRDVKVPSLGKLVRGVPRRGLGNAPEFKCLH